MIFSGCAKDSSYSDSAAIPSNTTQENNKAPSKTTENEKGVFDIREKMFIAQCNDIYLNPDEYKGRSIKIEGFCYVYTDSNTRKIRYVVMRKGPGCCGNDGAAGFEFTYDGKYPISNDWLEVIGTVEAVNIDKSDTVILRASQITVKDTRGAEYVAN